MEYTGQNQGRQEEHLIQPPGFGAYSSTFSMGWRGCASAMAVIKTPVLMF